MLNKPDLTFRARIRKGAGIGQDHRFMTWPECMPAGGGWKAADPDMEFDAEVHGESFISLSAPGFGKLGGKPSDYGNGKIFLHKISDLVVADKDLKRVVAFYKSIKREKLDKAIAEVVQLEKEIAALAVPNGDRQSG